MTRDQATSPPDPTATSARGPVRLLLVLAGIVILGGTIAAITMLDPAEEGGELTEAMAYLERIDRSQLPERVAALVSDRIVQVRENRDSSEAWGTLGEALDAHEIYQHAAYCYGIAEQLAPQTFHWPYLRAVALEYEGEDPAGAIASFRRAASIAPDFPPVFFRLGEALSREGQLPEARGALEEALRLDDELAVARRSLGQVLLQLDEVEEAIAQLTLAAEQHPDDRTVWLSLARAHQMAGNSEEASNASARSTDLVPTMALPDPVRKPVVDQALTAERFAERAAEYLAAGDLARARQALETSVELDPNNALVRARLGSVYVSLNEADRAQAQFTRALEIDDQLAGAHAGLGMIDLARQNPRSAIERFRIAIGIDPSHALAHARLGTALATTGVLDQAVAAFAEAERLGGMDARTYRNWGIAAEQLSDVGSALRQYRQSIRLAPDYIPARISLGRLLESIGRVDDAIDQYKAVERIDPTNAIVQRLRRLEGR